MLKLLWNISAAIRGYMRYYMPTSIAIDLLRTPRGLKWAIPVALIATPTYLAAMAICTQLAPRPGCGWLNLLVMLFFWNAMKFGVTGCMAPFVLVVRWLRNRLPQPTVRYSPRVVVETREIVACVPPPPDPVV